MNDMELLRELGQETPLPAPAELDAARARLAAAIASAPAAAGLATVPEVATDQPCPSSGQPAGPLRPSAPAPVLTAVRLMHAGAVGTAVYLIIALAFIGDIQAYHLRYLGHSLTAAQLSHQRPLIITLAIVTGLALIALWLWMARAVSQGRNWARILSTVLLGLATLEVTGNHGVAQVFCAVLTWLTGLAAVWLLWRPASSAFFRQCRQAALTRRP
ncbi:MAG TPA: hypothetical protein VIK57_25505 [Streptosporangiaceae bacterium]